MKEAQRNKLSDIGNLNETKKLDVRKLKCEKITYTYKIRFIIFHYYFE